jgi:hypothetical protein
MTGDCDGLGCRRVGWEMLRRVVEVGRDDDGGGEMGWDVAAGRSDAAENSLLL